MRFTGIFCIAIFHFLFNTASAQEAYLDTFIRKNGIHPVPPFNEWQQGTLFAVKRSKNKAVTAQPLLSIEATERLKQYGGEFGKKETEPHRFFQALDHLESHDSVAYFEKLDNMPMPYHSFFSALYNVEYNDFSKSISLFNNITASSDSFLMNEVAFWKTATQKMLDEQQQHNAVLATYTLMERSQPDSTVVMNMLLQVSLPQYQVHKFINLYNCHYRNKHYAAAGAVYDSIINYVTQSKMKRSLTENRSTVMEMLQGKQQFMLAMKNGLYHYNIDYLYDHLELWRQDTLTDKDFAAMAGFTLHRSTTQTDSIFSRWLVDTAGNEQLNKFEVLSLIRTPVDRSGRRFVMAKLGFSNEDTYKKYLSFLSRFKSKSILQSVLYSDVAEGNEYMLTQYFIAALYRRDDPLVKYELSIYSLEDAEGNTYAVDTLF